MRFNKKRKENTRIASVFESLITKENSIRHSIVLTVSFNGIDNYSFSSIGIAQTVGGIESSRRIIAENDTPG